MDEMTVKIGQALQELRNRNVDSSCEAANPLTTLIDEEQLPQEIVNFIQRRCVQRAKQRDISEGIYGVVINFPRLA